MVETLIKEEECFEINYYEEDGGEHEALNTKDIKLEILDWQHFTKGENVLWKQFRIS